MASSLKLIKHRFITQLGQSLVELMIVIGLCTLLLPVLISLLTTARQGKPQQQQRVQATSLLKEATEILRLVREKGWDELTTYSLGSTLHPVIESTSYNLSLGTTNIGDFTRYIILSPVITAGQTDPSVIRAYITVSWNKPMSSAISSTILLSRHLDNNFFTDDYTVDFNIGTTINTRVVSNMGDNDGAVILGPSGGGDWCSPQKYVVATYNLVNSGIPVSITAFSSDPQNLAYTTTGNNNSGNIVDKLTISQVGSSLTVANPNFIKKNTAYGIYSDGTYVYFNEKKPPGHIVRIVNASDLSDLSPEGYFDADNATGISVAVGGTTGYTTTDNDQLYAFDLSSKSGSRPQLGNSLPLAGIGYKVMVVGSNAYIATSNTSKQLQIVNVSNPSSMTLIKSVNLGNNKGATDLFVDSDQNYAYITTTHKDNGNDFFIVDLKNTNNIYGYSTTISVGQTGAGKINPQGIVMVSPTRAIIVGCNGGRGSNGKNCPINSPNSWIYQVFDISNPAAVLRCGGLSPEGVNSINAVAGVQSKGNVYSYIITNNTSAEFQIIQGGNEGSALYASFGTFISRPFPSTNPFINSVFFNRLKSNITLPTGTSLRFQVAGAPPNTNCADATYTFVGPDGTASTYFDNTGIIPWTGSPTYINPARCFKYKAYLYSNGDGSQTPILSDLTINYSP